MNIKKTTHVYKNNLDTSLLTNRQKEVYDLIFDGMKLSDARKISTSIVDKLISNAYLTKIDKEEWESEDKNEIYPCFKEITNDQKTVYDGIINSDKMINLLFGVTGSGKTEVYLHLARHYLGLGKQVLILVPEIALTPQMIERVKSRFSNVAIYHSYLNDNERYAEYMKVLKNKVNIVVGTRSSIFLPFTNLGLIIVDEEHDHSYKQDNTPCYSAKNVAFKRANDHGAKVVLASATPSLESYSRAQKGDYALFKLPNRINDTKPNIEIVDLKKEMIDGGSYIISNSLKNELDLALSNNKQAIILLNRRGYAPIIRCADCNSVLMCKDCETALTYHKDLNILKCNMCGKQYKMIDYCPKCGSPNLIHYGLGTKKVVETLENLFPDAKIGRMDADNTHVKDAHAKILNAFSRHEYDVLVGTQMIAKGLDYPDVTLVGILNADAGLLKTSFNSTEETFDLLMQASGRSGRGDYLGKVVIQAFNSDHYVLDSVFKQDYDLFYNIEMNYRYKANYPPYNYFALIIISDTNIKRLNKSINYLEDITIDLPSKRFKAYRLNKTKGKERYRFTFSNKSLIELISELNKIVLNYTSQKNMSAIKVDINPLYME